jgi:hypothetical protein
VCRGCAGSECGYVDLASAPPHPKSGKRQSRRQGRQAVDRNAGTNDMRNSALGRAKRTRDWLRVELEHFEQQLERDNTDSLRRRIVLIRGLYVEAQGKVKQLERNARAVLGSTAGDIPSPAPGMARRARCRRDQPDREASCAANASGSLPMCLVHKAGPAISMCRPI